MIEGDYEGLLPDGTRVAVRDREGTRFYYSSSGWVEAPKQLEIVYTIRQMKDGVLVYSVSDTVVGSDLPEWLPPGWC
jgi:hypothetical protein